MCNLRIEPRRKETVMQRFHKGLWTFVLAMLIGVFARPATALTFFDDFEGPTLNPFWSTYERSGLVVFPSTTHAHSGIQSLELRSLMTGNQKNIDVYHTFDTPQFGYWSVWLFDTGADEPSSNYATLSVYNTQLHWKASIGVFDYDHGPINGGAYVYSHPNGDAHSSVDRTYNWHEFVIESTPDILQFRVDGTPIYTGQGGYAFDQVALDIHAPSWRPAWSYSWDDFEFRSRNSVPEPGGVSLLLCGCIAGTVCFRRYRHYR
jgi:hypothetical protein